LRSFAKRFNPLMLIRHVTQVWLRVAIVFEAAGELEKDFREVGFEHASP